jgi:hypothetical protein
MIKFLFGLDLWANIIGGVVAAGLIALIALLWDRRKHRILKELIEIMGRAIKHRNEGERRAFTNQKEWVQQAKAIEEEAVAKAKELSSTAGSLVEWLDRIPPWDATDDVARYVSILSKVVERIRGLMERNT